jgi:tetratricopeptide (TPR) repeat protein
MRAELDSLKSEMQRKVEEKIESKKDTSIFDQYFQEGKSHFDSGDYKEAIKQFGKALKIDPLNQEARLYTLRALTFLKEGKTAEGQRPELPVRTVAKPAMRARRPAPGLMDKDEVGVDLLKKTVV